MHPNSRRAAALVSAVALAIILTAASTPIAQAEPAAAVPVIRVDGRGHGHGVGMSQWGAYTMASRGASAADIIGAFYPGTQLGNVTGEVVVVVDRRDHVRVRFPGGGEVRSARSGEQHPGFPVAVAPGETVDIVRTPAGYQVTGGRVAGSSSTRAVRFSARSAPGDCLLVICEPGDEPPSSTPPPDPTAPPTTSAPPSGGGEPAPQPSPDPAPGAAPAPQPSPHDPVSPTPVWAVPADGALVHAVDRNRTYRGLLEVTGPPGGVKVRNHLDIEQYLKGMAEVPGSWPAAAVQAQAIAARTYAMRAMASGGELCDSESCQVYRGTAHESPGQVAAVDATRGTVVTHGGALASTFYSASGGGFSANVAEGFGSSHDVPYLQARPYETVHPDVWTVDIALTDVARRLGYPGRVDSVTVDETGPSGRALRMTIHGDAGPVGVGPQDFRRRLGLRSTMFTLRSTETETAPPPPPEEADPGVVGDDPVEVRRPRPRPEFDALAAEDEVALTPLPTRDRPATLLVAVAALLAATVGALSLRTLSPGLVGRVRAVGTATMARWTNRNR
jgi:stage II sporulation protein D